MPRNKYRRNSPIESFRNHIPCGKLSCRNSCDHNSLQCIVCLKFFHYKCKGLSQSAYQNIMSNDSGYICSEDCFSATLPFFDSSEIVFLDTITHHDNLYPCKKCKLECLDKELMNSIECEVCNRWCHESCADLEYDFKYYGNESCDLFWTCIVMCAIENCLLVYYLFVAPPMTKLMNFSHFVIIFSVKNAGIIV